MIQTNTWGNSIMRQRYYRRYKTLHIIKGIAVGIITALVLHAFVAIIYSIPYSVIPPILAVFGVLLLILSISSNIKRNSLPKLGAANRGEFYAVIVLLISVLLYMNGRIDNIYQILITMK